jgi:co-chaperonin GroES (HSP10)
MNKFKVGDIVIPIYGIFKGTKCRIHSASSPGIWAIESLIPDEKRGHQCYEIFDTYRGWFYAETSLSLAESTEETVTIRFLTEKEFKHNGIWSESLGCPFGWNREMNKYLGKTIDLPKLKIFKDGCFSYEGWYFSKNDYEIVTPGTQGTVTVPQPEVESEVESKPEAKFKKGDKIIPNCYPFYDTPCEVIEDLDYEGDYLIKSLRLNEDRGDLNDDRSCVSFTSLRKATLVTLKPKSELELAKEQFPIGSYVKPNNGPFKDVVCKVVYHNLGAVLDEWIGVEGSSSLITSHNCKGHAKENSGWYYKVSEIVKVDPPKEQPVQACKFKVGDMVTYIDDFSSLKGQLAKVICTKDSHPKYFDESVYQQFDLIIEFIESSEHTHKCYSNGVVVVPSGKGRFVCENEITLVTQTEEQESKPKSKFQIGDTVIYNGYTPSLKGKVLTVTNIVFEPKKIRYEAKELNGRCTYDVSEYSLEKYNPLQSATSVGSTEWIPTTKLTNPKNDVNLSPELEYHQEPQLIKKPIKKSLITI